MLFSSGDVVFSSSRLIESLDGDAGLETHRLRAIGGYRDDLNYYEDSDLCQRLRDAGYDLSYEPAALATHQRTDTLIGLLALRWKYAEYRQKHLMDRYDGLLRKIDVNREYTLKTLARCLARRKEELAYVSFLLFFHHAVLDLRSLLSRRPMIGVGQRSLYERELPACIVSCVGRSSDALAEWVSRDLSDLVRSGAGCSAGMAIVSGWCAIGGRGVPLGAAREDASGDRCVGSLRSW